MRRLHLLIAALLAAAAVGVGSAPAAEQGGTGACYPKGSKTLLQNSVARVYRVRDDTGEVGTEACAFARGVAVELDSPHESIYGAQPPAMALKGTVVGYAKNSCGGDECYTSIRATDVASTGNLDITAVPATLKSSALVKVGSLAVNGAGALAWTTCPERSPSSEVAPTRNPNCVRAGDKDNVYSVKAGSRDRVRLDSGRDIDPSSLRRKGARVTWVAGGKVRSAPLG